MIEVDRATFVFMGVLSLAFCLICLGAVLSHIHDQVVQSAKPKPPLRAMQRQGALTGIARSVEDAERIVNEKD